MCGVPLLLFALLLLLLLPNISNSYSPSCSPPRIRIHPYICPTDRRGGSQGSSASFSEEKETEDRAPLLSLAPFSFSFPSFPSFSSFPSYSPCYPPPSARMRVLLRVFPHGLIVAFVRFVRSPARLPHYVRCSAAPFAEVPPMIMGTLVREVDCCVPCRSRSITTPRQMFSCGRPRKNPRPFETGIDPY